MWPLKFNNKMQSSLDWFGTLTKPQANASEKKTNEKKPTKRQMKSYTTGAKRYWMAWSVTHEKKNEGITSQPTSEGRGRIHCFYLLTPNYQLWEHCITKRKKMKRKFVIHRVKIFLSSSLFSFYQGMVKTMKMNFYRKKNIVSRYTQILVEFPRLMAGSSKWTCL